MIIEEKMQGNVETFRECFETFSSLGSHINENEIKS